MEPDSHAKPKRSLLDILFVIFLRGVAISCLWFGLQYWGMVVGYSFEGRGRFDLLNFPWRVAASALAVVYPVASLGLWLTVSWGPVLWTIAAGSQLVMFQGWPEIFGNNVLLQIMHIFVASLYVVFRLAIWLEEKRKMEERVRVDLP